MSLKLKIIAIVFLAITIPMTILGVSSYMKTSKALTTATESDLDNMGTAAAEAIKNEIRATYQNIEIMSLRQDLIDVASGNEEAKSSAFNYLSILGKEYEGGVLNFSILDKSGKAVITSDSMNPDMDLGGLDHIQAILDEGKQAASGVIVAQADGAQNIISIGGPLLSNGQVVGSLVVALKFDVITRHTDDIKIGENGYGFILDKEGLILSHPIEERVLAENLGDRGDDRLKKIIERAGSGEEGADYYSYDGVEKYVKYTPVDDFIVVVTANYDEYMAPSKQIRNLTLLIVLLSIIISTILVYLYITKRVVSPINQLQGLMSRVGNGDLTAKSNINTKDELQLLGEDFNTMISSQSKLVSAVVRDANEMQQSSEELAASIEEMTASTDQISNNVQNVASITLSQDESIVEISEVLVQLSSLIQIAQRRAGMASENSKGTMDAAMEGRVKIKEAVEAIENIRDVSLDTEEILKSLSQVSERVSGIIETIDGISNQTNLLALNANIEAARAGEHGKGFAVVAEEVRKLSEQTSMESSQISSLVNEMLQDINRAVDSMNISREAVENGVKVSNETDDTFVDIFDSVKKIGEDIDQISDITKDEVANSDKIIKLIDTIATTSENISTDSQDVAAVIEEQNAVSESLASIAEESTVMANELTNLVENFIVNEYRNDKEVINEETIEDNNEVGYLEEEGDDQNEY